MLVLSELGGASVWGGHLSLMGCPIERSASMIVQLLAPAPGYFGPTRLIGPKVVKSAKPHMTPAYRLNLLVSTSSSTPDTQWRILRRATARTVVPLLNCVVLETPTSTALTPTSEQKVGFRVQSRHPTRAT